MLHLKNLNLVNNKSVQAIAKKTKLSSSVKIELETLIDPHLMTSGVAHIRLLL